MSDSYLPSTDGSVVDSLESAVGSKTCSECGTSFPSVAKFCPDCGAAPTASSASVSHESSGPEITCYSCNERIPAAAKFCPECGGKPTAPSASTSRPITDDGSGPACAGCKKPISGRVVKANATTWHPDCFQCSQCAQPIEKDFVIRNLKPWCDKCVEWEKKEKKAGRTPSSRPVGSDERQSDSHSTPALRTDQVVCHQCNKNISGPAVSYSGKYYHKTCLTCKGCGQPLDPDKGFLTRAGQLYHDDCAKKLDGGDKSKRLCAECGKDLGTKYLSDGGKLFHASCIVCSVCKKAVGSTGFSKGKNGEILCETHAREPTPSTSTSTVPTGQVTSGIRFDHRTKTAYKVEGPSTLGTPTTTSAPTTTTSSSGLYAPPSAETGGRRVSLGGPAKVTCTGCFSPMMADALKCGVCGKANARRAFGERRSSAATAPAPAPTPAPAPKPISAPRPSAPNIRSPPPTSAPAKPPTATSPPTSPPAPAPTAPGPGPSSPLLCSECGSVLKVGSKFCGECGHRP